MHRLPIHLLVGLAGDVGLGYERAIVVQQEHAAARPANERAEQLRRLMWGHLHGLPAVANPASQSHTHIRSTPPTHSSSRGTCLWYALTTPSLSSFLRKERGGLSYLVSCGMCAAMPLVL